MTAPGWLLLWVDPRSAAGPALPATGARRVAAGVWAVPLVAGSPEEILAGCLAAGLPVRRSVVTREAVEVRGSAA